MSDAKERVEYRLRISLNEGKALDDALVSIAEEWQADKDELTRLRKAIEEAPPPKCDCESTRKFVVPIHHSKTCSVTLWELWKREALRGKSEPE